MSENEEVEDPENILIEILTSSGFKIIPLQTIIDALAEMEDYIKREAGITQNELEAYLDRLEELVGREEALKLDMDEILGWIRAFQSS